MLASQGALAIRSRRTEKPAQRGLSRRQRRCSVEYRRLDTQNLVQLRACRGVLKVNFLVRKDNRRGTECRERAFMKAAQNQLLFTRIGVDVANGKNARRVGRKFFGIDP